MSKVSPSILAANFMNLQQELDKIKRADYLHIDVMDGHFVPNITFGFPLIEALNKVETLPLDVHLMISDPSKYVDRFMDLGASIIAVHIEAEIHLHRLLERIKSREVKAFVALNPHTPVNSLESILPFLDGVLVMTVNPGFTGQKFIPLAAEKIRQLDTIRQKKGFEFEIAVDGGVNLNTAPTVVEYGADILVMGAAIFRSDFPEKVIEEVKGLKR
ncbi:ribulose-phosphate 3-epimerase [Kosmotoga arenicorallina S304]|uniref:Ribulose-phosphate 3-epimerase n=1 Tax=Kosmotoga arenicorallina S304 TaxID=1453497 RepID=A0A176K1Q3_9BACT|nr:ribulose-phosphate 3-epimerase [Kosmotoga arenicorallina]OAA30904.1 ribulose-phosphate 3-epimerase [Kosmotoga arenicorallina S304]